MANPLKLLKLKPTGFQFIQELPIDAPPKKVWASLLKVGNWFRFGSNPADWDKHTLEPRVGGTWMYETKSGDQNLMGFITRMDPGKLLRLGGPCGMTHLPVNHVFIFELQPRNGSKGTLLRFCQRTFGFIQSDTKKSMQGGWGSLLPQLKSLAEGR